MRRVSNLVTLLIVLLLTASTLFAGGSSERDVFGDYEKKDTWLVDEPVMITVLTADHTVQPLKNYAPAQQAIFEETGIRIEFQISPASSYEERKSVQFATNNWPDVASVTTRDVTMYAPTGIYEPLLQYVNEETMPNFYKFWTEYESDVRRLLIEGDLYAFPKFLRDETANGFGPMIRLDLLEKHGLEIPQTFDEIIDVLAELKAIYPDSIPYTGRYGTEQLLKTTSYMLGSGYGQTGIYYDHDRGEYVFGPADENFKAVLSWLNEAYERGVLDPDFATTTAEQMESKLSSGRSFFYLDNSGFGVNYTKTLRRIPGNEDAVIQLIPIPENSFGVRRAVSYDEPFSTDTFYAVNSSSDKKDVVIKLFDWMYSRRGSDITNYGKEGYSFEYDENGEPQYILSFLEPYKDASPSSYYAVWSDLGVTKVNFNVWAMNTRPWFEIEQALGNWDDINEQYWSTIANDPAYVGPVADPPLTTEESERATDILLELTTYLNQQYNNFIMGISPIDDWDNVIERCERIGVRELEEIYNNANRRISE